MTQMPGTARCARAILVVVGTVNAATVAWLTAAAATLETGALGELVLGILLLAAIVSAALAIASFTIAAKFTHGSSKTRTGAAAVGWITILAGTIALLTDHPMGPPAPQRAHSSQPSPPEPAPETGSTAHASPDHPATQTTEPPVIPACRSRS
ncbi:hypothetical protein SAVCW2_74210 [Streptomyces avermitilis]|uniref:hypothetical protein n=1 Tax=Streptomyces avermitilis TaxID=33903 RepID=UPI0010E8C724|nr:hypothetical protein [Streptomyces avermitilis]GDY88222.1 hypothetical protein SAVCW2_74210 [Streptomyces avermitilis]